ncbi:hypothetical protein HOU52_gp27 [Arthrobacter phage Yang]|uniref:Uncharacterized protein n=1 Tax=Arthrobacter phage Yang TaxID=2419970 RepID=A0A3G2KJE8_9CAUD|nr:hypothetical protein HOU52_gp27 [Arthrobacter phage Yang]AYN59113.1 hypothetical protein PBI_YANG_27 [Arthrobacter phage Yang]
MSDLTPKPIKATPFLTVIADRHPRQKAHTTRGHAHAALSQRASAFRMDDGKGYARRLYTDVALYEWRDEDWRLLWEGKRGDVIDRAAPPWKKA